MMGNVILGEEEKQKILSVQSLIREYLQEKGFTDEEINEKLPEEQKNGLSASQKIILQQMIRERAMKDGKNLDELIQKERAKKQVSVSNPRGQILGSLSKIEGAYIEILLQEKAEKKTSDKSLGLNYHK